VTGRKCATPLAQQRWWRDLDPGVAVGGGAGLGALRTQWRGYNARMVALEVSINGQRVCLAGASGVVWCTMYWGRFVKPDGESWLRVGGREYGQPKGGDFFRWLEHSLQIGDEVTVRLVESETVDLPASTSRQL
jgi:hypothetical protein